MSKALIKIQEGDHLNDYLIAPENIRILMRDYIEICRWSLRFMTDEFIKKGLDAMSDIKTEDFFDFNLNMLHELMQFVREPENNVVGELKDKLEAFFNEKSSHLECVVGELIIAGHVELLVSPDARIRELAKRSQE